MKIELNVKAQVNKEKVVDQLKKVLFEAMLKMHSLAVMKCPVDTGILRGSIRLNPMFPGSENYVLADGVDYGIHVEYGTSPHYVSPDNLFSWSQRVLGDKGLAYPVSRKIARFGVEAQPYMRPALKQVKDIHLKEIMAKHFKQQSL